MFDSKYFLVKSLSHNGWSGDTATGQKMYRASRSSSAHQYSPPFALFKNIQ
ncbi:MAG: hypothetical protein MUF58_13850 [Arcicella sp.]|nr:hypothetical protein [Arcicella sp.]